MKVYIHCHDVLSKRVLTSLDERALVMRLRIFR